MPEIVKAGHLFIAQPPLYKVAKGRSEVYLKDDAALDRYLVDGGLQGRILETAQGARADADLRAMVEHALRLRNLMGFVPRRYDAAIIEQMALSGALDPSLDRKTREQALQFTAQRLGLGDTEAEWSAYLGDDGNVRFERLWRGVTDVHEIDGRFLFSTEAHKLHGLASEHAEAYAAPARLVKRGDADAEMVPSEDTEADELPVQGGDDIIMRPTQLLEAVLAAGRKGLSTQRYKGLGEMNEEQLWETTLDPENRALLQVKVEDADVTDEIFTRLMGDVVEPRREFIQENALNVANLDV
jgi:DNA gyrase subunit B